MMKKCNDFLKLKIIKILKLTTLLVLVAGLHAFAAETTTEQAEGQVVLSADEALADIAVKLQPVTVTGTVTDVEGLPYPGVYIQIQGTTRGAMTDTEGNYTIAVEGPDDVLIYSFVGTVTQEIQVGNQTTINVILVTEVSQLQDIVVVGYGTQKKATITGSISTVSGTQLQKSPSINFSNAFAGRLPGLLVVTRSGEPGNDASMLRIRGSNTLGDNRPLVVVDGISNRDMNRINPSDIENITVLKDASAAIYGAQAANGVILITTKRGRIGKPMITVNLNQGWSMPTVLPEMADAPTYATMINEINYYNGNPDKFSAEEIQKFSDGSDPWGYPDTDWYAETMKPAASQRYANIVVRGGSEMLKYFVSLGTNYQDGIYKNSATSYEQTTFRSNLDGKISDNINLSIDVSGRQETRNYPTRSAGTIFAFLMRGKPTLPAYWPNGFNGPDIEYGDNPVAITTNQTGYDKTKNYVLESVMKLNITFPWIQGLSFIGNVSFDKSIENRKLWQKPWFLYTWDGVTYDGSEPALVKGQRGFEAPQLRQSMQDGQRTTINALINYERSFSSHNISVLMGSERRTGDEMSFWAFRKYFVSPAVDQMFAGGDLEKDNSGSASQSARLNYFGRLNYDYLGKYLAEFVWRYDGSFIFPEEHRYGFFPGVSLGWRVSEENFWKSNISFIDYFKLRGSWGQTGNDRIETYQYLSSYGYASKTYVFGTNVEEKLLAELRIPNPEVTWEVANQTNIGFDGAILNSRVDFSADYFYNHRTNILWYRSASVPESSGLSLPRENIGEVVNQGFDFQVRYNNSMGDFNYLVSVNGGYQKNRIEFWDETPGIPDYQKSTGYPMNAELFYQSIGVFEDQAAVDAYPHWANARPGDIIFEDVNDDGEINGLDMVRNEKTTLPTFSGGLNIDLRWKNFYSTLLLQYATGAIRNNYYEMQGEAGNFLAKDAEGRWTEDNPSTTKPRTWNRYFGYWRQTAHTYYLHSTDYLRLKNFELGYDLAALPAINQLGMESFRIYFSGLNLFTLDKLKDFDPETTSATSYPLSKVFNIGVSLTF